MLVTARGRDTVYWEFHYNKDFEPSSAPEMRLFIEYIFFLIWGYIWGFILLIQMKKIMSLICFYCCADLN